VAVFKRDRGRPWWSLSRRSSPATAKAEVPYAPLHHIPNPQPRRRPLETPTHHCRGTLVCVTVASHLAEPTLTEVAAGCFAGFLPDGISWIKNADAVSSSSPDSSAMQFSDLLFST